MSDSLKTKSDCTDFSGLKLCELHSLAVDYMKTGVIARMPPELRPRKWPHFMEKANKPKEQIYTSKKVLGQLYDQVERVDFVPDFAAPFDKRILEAYSLDDQLLAKAAEVKEEYDGAMRRILAQYDIRTEFEVWTTFVLHHTNEKNDYKFHEEMGDVSSALKDRFQKICYDAAGGKEFETIGPFVAAMYKVTSIEMAQALAECRQVKIVGTTEQQARQMVPASMPLMSFPWLFQGLLGKIANGDFHLGDGETSNPIMIVPGEPKKTTPKKTWIELGLVGEEDTLQTKEGITHRGQVLELFQSGADDGKSKNSLSRNPSLVSIDAFQTMNRSSEQGVIENTLQSSNPESLLDSHENLSDHYIPASQPVFTASPVASATPTSAQAEMVEKLIDLGLDDQDETTVHRSEQNIHRSEQDIHTSEQDIHTPEQDIHTPEQDINTSEQDIHISEQNLMLDIFSEADMLEHGSTEQDNVHSAVPQLVENLSAGMVLSAPTEIEPRDMHDRVHSRGLSSACCDETEDVTSISVINMSDEMDALDSGGEEEAIEIQFDDKPSLLEQLAKLNE